MTARDELYAYTTVAFKETGVPPVVHEHVTKLLSAYQDEVLGDALDELAAVKKELAFIESLICQCQPERKHDDYRRAADYMHAADCPVSAAQQAAH